MPVAISATLSLLCITALALVAASPEAKLWAAELLEHLAQWLTIELRARAKAQSAARAVWQRTYREQRGGNCNPDRIPVLSEEFCKEHERQRQIALKEWVGLK